MTWQDDKGWSDRFLDEIKGICGRVFITEPTVEEDALRNTDLIVLRLEPLRIANRMAGREHYRWVVLSKDGAAVRASNGVLVSVDAGLAAVGRGEAALRPLDMVLACSGLWVERYRDDQVFAWLRRQERLGTMVGALCTVEQVGTQAGGQRANEGWVKVEGELWHAISSTPLRQARTVRIVGRSGLRLEVVPVEGMLKP